MKTSEEAAEIYSTKIRIKEIKDYFDCAEVETLLNRHHPLGAKKAMGRSAMWRATVVNT